MTDEQKTRTTYRARQATEPIPGTQPYGAQRFEEIKPKQEEERPTREELLVKVEQLEKRWLDLWKALKRECDNRDWCEDYDYFAAAHNAPPEGYNPRRIGEQ